MGLLSKASSIKDGTEGQAGKKKRGLLSRATLFKKGSNSERSGLKGLLSRASFFRSEKKKETDLAGQENAAVIEQNSIEQVQAKLDRKIFDLANLFEISKEINSTLNIDELITILLFTSMGQMGVSMVTLFARDEQGRFLLRGQKGAEGVLPDGANFAAQEPLLAFFRESGKPNSFEELRGRLGSENEAMLSELGAALVVPLLNKEKMTGFLVLGGKYDKSPFTIEERDFLTTLASMAAIAIENARLYSNLEQKVNELSALYEISCIINSSGELDEVLELASETLATGFGLKQAAFIGIKEEQCLLLRSIGLSEGSVEKFAVSADGQFFGALLEAGETVDFPDFNQQSEICDAFAEEDLSLFQSVLFVPLMAAGEKLGLLAVFSLDGREKRPFTKEEQELFAIIASQLAPPIKMASMVAQARHQTTDPFHPYLERLNEAFKYAEGFDLSLGVTEIQIANEAHFAVASDASSIETELQSAGDTLRGAIDQKYSVIRTGAFTFSLLMPGITLDEQEELTVRVKQALAEIFSDAEITLNSYQLPEDYKDPASFIFQRF